MQLSNDLYYYNSLIASDKGNAVKLVEILKENIKDTISAYEELINEDQRQKEWLKQYSEIKEDHYEKVKSKHSYDYEVWKNQMAVFKTLFKKSLQEIGNHIPQIDVEYKDYEVITFNQYLDILEDRPISNTGYMFVKLFDRNTQDGMTLVFYFQRLYVSKLLKIADEKKKNPRNFRSRRPIPPAIKLNISARQNGVQISLDDKIDLVNIGTYKDQLSFGIINRKVKREAWQKPKLDSRTDPPGNVIRDFIDQLLQLYFDIHPKK